MAWSSGILGTSLLIRMISSTYKYNDNQRCIIQFCPASMMASSSVSLAPEVANLVSVDFASISVVKTITSISAVVSTPARFNSYVFLDLETTGFITPEDPKCRITELSMWAIERQQFLNCNGTKLSQLYNFKAWIFF
jgi:hypothetical protein